MEDHQTLLLETYKILREEILESIRLQNKIIMGVGTAVGIILGLGLTGTEYSALVISIPFIVAILTSWWIVEQSRMMRAGDFMQFIEDMINLEVRGPYVMWENWLRRDSNERKDLCRTQKIKEWVKPKDPHKIHHVAQYICVVGIFYGISIISLILLFVHEPLINLEISDTVRWILTLFPATILGILLLPIVVIILHRGSPAEKEDFKKWLDKYWENIEPIYKRREDHESSDD